MATDPRYERGGNGYAHRNWEDLAVAEVGKWSKTANIPGVKATDPIAYPAGMPGVKVGQ
jgi:hypothetical protein